MKRVLLFISLMFFAKIAVQADPVDKNKAQTVGQKFLNNTLVGQQTIDIKLNLVSIAIDEDRGDTDYYVFNVEGYNGFVIVAGDDRVKPILAYSTTGSFNSKDLAEGFEFMLNSYRHDIQYVREHDLSATSDIVAEWDAIMKHGQIKLGRNAQSVVGPLCQTLWHQRFPYNSQCIADTASVDGYVRAGCISTAMGQLMKFWNYPERGTGSHTYTPNGYTQQTANFGETDYHFELMPLALDSTSSEEDYFYVAQLLHHCGIAVNMHYGASSSYANEYLYVPIALRDFFRFSCDDPINYYTITPGSSFAMEWALMLKTGGLDEGVPLYYSGADNNHGLGHAFVCDGYDENDYFHFNWGWSGQDNAWCALGALNTTKYSFNDTNGFIGHIIPQDSNYYMRADSVSDFTVTENDDFAGVRLSWINPAVNLNGDPLSSIELITIRRNNQEVVTLTNVQAGAALSYSDTDLEPGLYQYSIFVTNAFGISRNVYRDILVGKKCELLFELRDSGGDGWKGASISVTAENGQRIAVIGMDEGYETKTSVPLLRQNLSFIWNHGWYHNVEGYDTDYECSFSILDADSNELYSSVELEDGVFMIYENFCYYDTLTCYPVQNLHGEYQWHNGNEYGAYLIWNNPTTTENLDHFNVIRKMVDNEEEELIAEVPFDGSSTYEFFDNSIGDNPSFFIYAVNSVYIRNEEQCESEYEYVMIHITDVTECNAVIHIYPNPTNGIIYIENQGVMRIVIMDLFGLKLYETTAECNVSVDLSHFNPGIYMLCVETPSGTIIQKVSVSK